MRGLICKERSNKLSPKRKFKEELNNKLKINMRLWEKRGKKSAKVECKM